MKSHIKKAGNTEQKLSINLHFEHIFFYKGRYQNKVFKYCRETCFLILTMIGKGLRVLQHSLKKTLYLSSPLSL